jgi:hypothetical protein
MNLTEIIVLIFLKDYKDELINAEYAVENSTIVDCCDVLIDILEEEQCQKTKN